MGIHRPGGGYSATVEGFFVVAGQRFRIAKTNAREIVFAEECELAPNTEGELLIIIDGTANSKRISISGVALGRSDTEYQVLAPF